MYYLYYYYCTVCVMQCRARPNLNLASFDGKGWCPRCSVPKMAAKGLVAPLFVMDCLLWSMTVIRSHLDQCASFGINGMPMLATLS